VNTADKNTLLLQFLLVPLAQDIQVGLLRESTNYMKVLKKFSIRANFVEQRQAQLACLSVELARTIQKVRSKVTIHHHYNS